MDPANSKIPFLKNLSTQKINHVQGSTIVGRHADCDIVLSGERGASRKHARLSLDDNRLFIMDLGSLNGTLVNGREIDQRVELLNNDSIIFDEQEYKVFIPAVRPSQSSSAQTVVVNKDEALHPERIKPAIKILDNSIDPALDKTNEWDPATAQFQNNPDRFDDMPIAATSRPGGDAMPNRTRSKKIEPNTHAWKRWYVWVPLALLVLLAGIYFAYHTGLTTQANNGFISNKS